MTSLAFISWWTWILAGFIIVVAVGTGHAIRTMGRDTKESTSYPDETVIRAADQSRSKQGKRGDTKESTSYPNETVIRAADQSRSKEGKRDDIDSKDDD